MEALDYVVCESCAYLSAQTHTHPHEQRDEPDQRCPLCGGRLAVYGQGERFPPTYVARAALQLHATPPL